MLYIDVVECITASSTFHFEPNISCHNVCQYHERYAATGYKTILILILYFAWVFDDVLKKIEIMHCYEEHIINA